MRPLGSSGCEEEIDDGVADEAAVVDWVEFSEVSPPAFEWDVVVIGRIDMFGVRPLWMGMADELLIVDVCCGWSEW